MKRYTDKKIEMVRSLLLQGRTQSEVSKTTGVNKASVKYYSKKMKKKKVDKTPRMDPSIGANNPDEMVFEWKAKNKATQSLADRIADKVTENIKAHLTELLG